MSEKDDKLKTLDELTNPEGGSSPGGDDDKSKTQEISKEKLAEMIKLERMKKEAEENETQEPVSETVAETPKAPEPPEQPEESPEAPLKDTAVEEEKEVDTAAEEEAPIKVTEEDEPPPVMEGEYQFRPPARPAASSTTRTLLLVVLLLLLILFYFIFFKKHEAPPGPVTTTTQETAAVTGEPETVTEEPPAAIVDTIPAKPADKEEPPPVYELSDEAFQGAAPLTVKPSGPVISEEVDPEIAAVADALKVRVTIINGSKTRTSRGIKTTISSGVFQGFKVTHTLQEKADEVIRDEIAVVTPTRGILAVKGNILDSIKRTDYEKFQRDLEASGIEVTKSLEEEEGVINVQLRITKFRGKPIQPAFLVGPDNLGPVKLSMPIEDMKEALKGYELVPKRILHGDTYYDTYKVLDRRNQSLFFINEKDGKVWGIQVVSDKFKTGGGLGIGNTLAQVRIYYLKNAKLSISATPAGAPFVSVQGMSASFFLQGKGMDFNNQVFPNDLKISNILLGGSPFMKLE